MGKGQVQVGQLSKRLEDLAAVSRQAKVSQGFLRKRLQLDRPGYGRLFLLLERLLKRLLPLGLCSRLCRKKVAEFLRCGFVRRVDADRLLEFSRCLVGPVFG